MSPPSSAQLTKSQVQEMRDWTNKAWSKCCTKHSEEHEYKCHNPGALPINLYLTEKLPSQPFDFGKIGEVQGETTETVVTARKERGQKELSSDLVQSSGDILYLASDASSRKMKSYVLQQDVTTFTKKSQGRCALVLMCSIH